MLVAKFLQYIKYEKIYSSHTFVSYQTDLIQFRSFVESRSEVFDPAKIDSPTIREWVVSLMEAGDSASSVNRKLSALKSFFKFLKQHGYVSRNPMKGIVVLKKAKCCRNF